MDKLPTGLVLTGFGFLLFALLGLLSTIALIGSHLRAPPMTLVGFSLGRSDAIAVSAGGALASLLVFLGFIRRKLWS